MRAIRRAVDDLAATALTSEDVRRMATEWTRSLQVTEPRASLADVDSLLETTSEEMLVDTEPRSRTVTKRTIVKTATVRLERAIGARPDLIDADVRVEGVTPISGSRDKHYFDMSVRNGKVLFAVQAITFNRASTSSHALEQELGNLAWILGDVTAKSAHPQLAVLATPPANRSDPHFRHWSDIFRSYDADVVETSDRSLGRWASGVANAL